MNTCHRCGQAYLSEGDAYCQACGAKRRMAYPVGLVLGTLFLTGGGVLGWVAAERPGNPDMVPIWYVLMGVSLLVGLTQFYRWWAGRGGAVARAAQKPVDSASCPYSRDQEGYFVLSDADVLDQWQGKGILGLVLSGAVCLLTSVLGVWGANRLHEGWMFFGGLIMGIGGLASVYLIVVRPKRRPRVVLTPTGIIIPRFVRHIPERFVAFSDIHRHEHIVETARKRGGTPVTINGRVRLHCAGEVIELRQQDFSENDLTAIERRLDALMRDNSRVGA